MNHPVRLLPQYRGTNCLNCKTPLEEIDKYCHQCGQLNSTKRLALTDFFQEIFANIISYDNKIWRTISGILFKPGKITKEYCAGKRVSYANPFRFFLSVSIVFFLVGQLFLSWDEDFTQFVSGVNQGFENGKSFVTDGEQMANLIKQRDSLEGTGNAAASAALTNAIERIETAAADTLQTNTYLTESQLGKKNFLGKYLAQTSDYKNHSKKNPNLTIQQALEDIGHEDNKLNGSRYRKAMRFNDLEKRPYQMVEMVVPKIPLFLFFFAPILSLFLWLLYVRHDCSFMEHMVFTFHIFTFFFLSLFILTGIVAISFGLISWEILALLILGIGGPIYLYKAMRRFYAQGRFKTILKFTFLNFVFFLLFTFSASIFIIGSVFIGA